MRAKITTTNILSQRQRRNSIQMIGCVLLLILFFGFNGNAQTKPTIKTNVDTTYIRIGEQIKWKITIGIDSTDQVIFPEGQTFSPLETVEAYATDTTRKNDRLTLQKIYALTQFDSGTYKLQSTYRD